VPESPRWLLLHGYTRRARDVVDQIEHEVGEHIPPSEPVLVHITGRVGFGYLVRTLLASYRKRTVPGFAWMFAQATLYNAVFFSYALVLRLFYGVAPAHVGLYIVPVAIGNFLGPLVLGPLFDRIGRRVMIPATYAASGLLLAITAMLFWTGWLDALPDGQRAVPRRAARSGDRRVLRVRDARRRGCGVAAERRSLEQLRAE
jgi:hypothetical protein